MAEYLPEVAETKVIEIPDQPCQPRDLTFPFRSFGKTKPVRRSFQASWFQKYKWLHYEAAKDAAFCFSCCKAVKSGKLKLKGTTENTFLISGFTNWKDATRALNKHGSCDFHRHASEIIATTADISEMLSKQTVTEREKNRECFIMIAKSLRHLARQGLPIRGSGDESNSNFIQLLKLVSSNSPHLSSFLAKKQLKFTSHDIQNELLSIMSQHILRQISRNLQSSYYAIMADEVTETSNCEQVAIVIRWVDDSLMPHEEFIGLYKTDSITSQSLVSLIKDVLLRLGLTIEKCRGQCYDGASNMSGSKHGVAKQILDDETRAVYTHCYGQTLNLAVGDVVKQCKVMRHSLETVHEISKLIKKSPKRDAIFHKLKSDLAHDTPSFRVLCPTRWTVRSASLQSVLDNFKVLLGVWEESIESSLNSEMRARVIGVHTQMLTFDFLFGVSLGALLLRHSDNLSKSLQHEFMSAADGQHIAKRTLDVLLSLRTAESFQLFYRRVLIDQDRFQVSPPSLPRKRRAPHHLEVGSSASDYPACPEDHYRHIYFEGLDLIVEAIKDRFDQPGYQVYKRAEDLVLKACKGDLYESELDYVCSFYKDDLCKEDLVTQLPLLHSLFVQESIEREVTISSVSKILSKLSPAQRVAFSNVWELFKLLLVMPATNAGSERSFSALRRVKTYLRSTMGQERLNNLMILHIHLDYTDSLNMLSIGNEFIQGKEIRQRMFGNFL